MTTPISTGRERRVRQEQPERFLAIDGEDRRTGPDRRVASYRWWLDCYTYRDFYPDLILALRRKGVVAFDGTWMDDYILEEMERWRGKRVRVIVEEV